MPYTIILYVNRLLKILPFKTYHSHNTYIDVFIIMVKNHSKKKFFHNIYRVKENKISIYEPNLNELKKNRFCVVVFFPICSSCTCCSPLKTQVSLQRLYHFTWRIYFFLNTPIVQFKCTVHQLNSTPLLITLRLLVVIKVRLNFIFRIF